MRLILLLFTLMTSGFAAEDSLLAELNEATYEMQTQATPDLGVSFKGTIIRMVVSLVGILLLMGITYYVLRKISRTRYHQMNHTGAIKLIESRPISPKSMLYLVEIEGKRVLFAESQAEIRQLSTIDGE